LSLEGIGCRHLQRPFENARRLSAAERCNRFL
jgi:hypothetical protein